jgi:hypothetical protein
VKFLRYKNKCVESNKFLSSTARSTMKFNLNKNYLYKPSLISSECEPSQRRVYSVVSLDDGKNAL